MEKSKITFSLLFKWIFRILLIVLTGYYILTNKNGSNINYISNGVLILFCSFLPDIICNLFRFNISSAIDFLIQSFIFLALFLGRMYNYYSIISWWDLFLHFLSGVILGFLALTLLKSLTGKKTFLSLSPLFVAVFLFLFTVSTAALWEFWEFAGDQLFGFDSQLFSLVDTMTDMILGTVGGIIASIMGFIYIKHGTFSFLSGFVTGAWKRPEKK